MKANHVLFALMLSIGLFTCDQGNSSAESAEAATQPAISLEGTWKMTANQPQDTNVMVATEFTMIKIFGEGHFAFVYYNPDSAWVTTAGGGVYELQGDTLKEILTFFSGDSTVVGETLTYKITGADNSYRQSGVIPGFGAGGSDYIIEEEYERIEPAAGASEAQAVAGVWKMDKALYGDAEEAAPLADGWEAMKFITPGHFYIAQYHPGTGSFDGFVFGSYEIKDGKYVETIKATSRDSTIIGAVVSYDYQADGNSFVQKGMVNSEQFPNFKIEEYFTRAGGGEEM